MKRQSLLMKRQILFMCLVLLMCCSVAIAQNEPADSVQNARAVNISELFSKQFVLPETYIMNAFSFEVAYIVYADKSSHVDQIKFTSNITKRTTHKPTHPDFAQLERMNYDLKVAIANWLTANGDVLAQTVGDFEFEDSIPLVTQVYYSPLLYAQAGDTLFCTATLENEYLSEAEEAGTYYDYHVRNQRNTPYFALVRRSRNNVTLMVHNTETGNLFNIVSYHIMSADQVEKSGNQMYMGEDGKSLRIKQVWKDNKLVSAEKYDSEKRVEARYEFCYPALSPKLKKKEVLNPDGSVKTSKEYDTDIVIATQQPKDDVVFIVVDQMPEFPGGVDALIRFLNENVKYPEVAKANKIEGRVMCQFVVDKDGTITDIVVVKSGGDPSLDKEAVRVLRTMPKWKPGRMKGEPVRVKYTIPVNFKLTK